MARVSKRQDCYVMGGNVELRRLQSVVMRQLDGIGDNQAERQAKWMRHVLGNNKRPKK